MNHDLGPLPLENPRCREVQQAREALDLFLLSCRLSCRLTPSEECLILAELLRHRLTGCVASERRKGEA